MRLATHHIGYAPNATGLLPHCKKPIDINVKKKNPFKPIAVTQGKAMNLDPNKCVAYIMENAPKFAKAKAERVFIENYLRTVKSRLMQNEEGTLGNKEAYAYAHPDYEAQLKGLQAATEQEENLKFMLLAAQMRHDTWKTQEYSKRQELKNLP